MRSEIGLTKILHCLICNRKIFLAGWSKHMLKRQETHLRDSVCECSFSSTTIREFIDHFIDNHTKTIFACLCGKVFPQEGIDSHFIYVCVCPTCNRFRRYCTCTNNHILECTVLYLKEINKIVSLS